MFKHDENTVYPGYLIHQISHDFLLKKNKNLIKYNLTDSQIKVMNCLWRNDNIAQTEIQKFINIKPSSLTRLLDTLEKKGFIVRLPSIKDSRVKLISLTNIGTELKKEAWDTILSLEDKLINGFTKEEKDLAVTYLRRMLNNITSERDDLDADK